MIRFGNWNNGSNDGLWYVNGNYTPGNTNINVSDRDNHGRQKLRAKIYLSLTRMINRVKKAGSASRMQARSILSRWGFVKHSDCKDLQNEIALFVQKYKIKEAAKTWKLESTRMSRTA